MVWRFWRQELLSRQIPIAVFNDKIRALKKDKVLPCQFERRVFQEKPLSLKKLDPYRNPTQVDEASSLRGTGDSSLRNSAKKRP